MQKLKLISLMLSIFGAFMLPQFARAATPPANAEPLEEVQPPPKITDGEPLDDAAEPKITIRKKGADTIEEYRINGEMYMMKVTPAHGVPYYLHKEDSEGGWVNTGPNKPLSIPKWIIFRF